MDAAFWALELDQPTRIEAQTTPLFAETAPAVCRITYEFPARGSRPPVRFVWRDGDLAMPRPPQLADGERLPGGRSGQLFVGDDGVIGADMYGREPQVFPTKLHHDVIASPPPPRYPRSPGVYLRVDRGLPKAMAPPGPAFQITRGRSTRSCCWVISPSAPVRRSSGMPSRCGPRTCRRRTPSSTKNIARAGVSRLPVSAGTRRRPTGTAIASTYPGPSRFSARPDRAFQPEATFPLERVRRRHPGQCSLTCRAIWNKRRPRLVHDSNACSR